MSFLSDFLDCYVDHIEDYEALVLILSLLPDSYVYVFVRNLLGAGEFLDDGNVYEGVALVGIIKVVGDVIVLESGVDVIVLLELPPAFEL